ncbi:MAG TPA: choice-of-anchor D domain-containing protein, partial [Burkholderiaceae bacterium]
HLDPNKRYFISILPGDSVNPTIGGPGSQPVDPANPAGPQRPFDIGKDCGAYPGPTTDGPWAPAGGSAMCGHGMTGAQISRELLAAANPSLTIKAQETPLPTAKISVLVYQDDNPLNGENDAGGGVDVIAPNEAGLGGFEIKLFDQAGQLGDNTGQITYDEFNQPVSNSLANTIDPITKLDACPISARGDGLVGMIPTCPKYESDGKTLSPLAGQAVIANLYPGLYEIQAYPAADRIGRGEEWVQTNTLDGGKPHEAFIKPNEPGYFQEFGPGGFHVTIGFANPAIINNRLAAYCASPANGGGTGAQACDKKLTVHVANSHMSRSPDQRMYSSGSYDNYSFTNCYVSIGPADAADFAFAKCDANGTAVFNNIPNGTYKISVFDQWNDIMLDGLVGTVAVAGDTEKEFPVTQWRTNLYTRTFIDSNGDGVSQDPGELGLALVNTNIRYRDGSFAFFNNTDLNGYAAWNEVFPFMNWLVVETSATRFKTLGVHSVYDAGGPVDCDVQSTICSNIADHLANTDVRVPLPLDLRMPGAVYCDDADCAAQNLLSPAATISAAKGASTGMISPPQPFGTTMAWQGMLGQNTFMEFPVKPFNPGENGGINGQVVYASTRPFDDPTMLLQLSWEPGVANVKVNLYSETVDASGNTKLQLVDTTMSASFDDWAQGFRKDASGNYVKAADGTSYVPNMNCPGQDASSPFFATLKNSKMWLDAADATGNKKPLAYQSQFKCYDGWSQLNQAQPAPYDGKYSFPSVNTVGADGKPASTNCHMYSDAEPWGCKLNLAASPSDWDYNKPVLVAGKYVVEVVVPAGYELVKEEDKNILLGDVFIAPVTQQFAGFGNVFIMPDQATINANYNQHNPGNINLTSNLGSVTFPRHEGDTGSIEAYWPCVGAERIVPDLNSLYPQAGQASPFAGAKRRLCDRKEVQLDDQSSSLAKFYIFSSTHIAGHFTGTITNDFASEFDPFSPQFGEKFGPPNLPVGLRDFNGYEVARVYSDQWGIYNGLYYSTWTVNPPNPTGYAPEMSIACMNDPGPILAADGKTLVTDPQYNPAYSNFCYEQPFMPGTTTYMDTPVIPTMSFADGYNLPDAEYPDGTPAIASVSTGSSAFGPWVDASPPVGSVTVGARGQNYTSAPTVSFSGGGGSGAAATATMRVASIQVTTPGVGYTNLLQPNNGITVSGGGGTGAAAVTASLKVVAVNFTQGVGNCSTGAGTVTRRLTFNTGGAIATATITNGRVTGIVVNDGSGYIVAPTATLTGCPATTLTLTPRMGVGTVQVALPGSGYTSEPTVNFGAPPSGTGNTTASAVGLLSLNAVTVTAGGSGYSTAPTVAFAGGGGSGATATAVLGSGDGAGVTITINALGDKPVQNPNFSGPNSTGAPYNQKTITRHYGFGSNTGGNGTVALVGADGVQHLLTGVTWSDMKITGNVPSGVPLCSASNKSYTNGTGNPNAGARCGQLVITNGDNGKSSIDTVTVTIGGTKPWVVSPGGVTDSNGNAVSDNGAAFGRMGLSPIQLAIDKANPGDLLLVQPGTYKENLIMWKPVRLQGVGAAAVTINADAHPAGKMDQWRRQINCAFGLDLQGVPNLGNSQSQYDPSGLYSCPASMFQRVDRIPFEAIVGWDASGNGNLAQVLQEPTLMGAYEGAGITVLARGVRIPAGNTDFWGQNATGGAGAFTDGSRYLTGGNVSAAQAAALGYPGTGGNDCAINPTEVDGRDYGTGNFFCNPSRIDGVSIINSSQGGGGVFVHGWAQNLEVANTRISGNQGTLAGAINLGNGETPDAFINDGVECGVVPSVTPCPPIGTNPLGVNVASGAAIPFQFNTGVRIHHNMLYDNASIGDALFSGTPSGAGAITVSAGADNYRIDHNWIAGNLSTGDGGGVQHLGMAFNGKIDHNFILYNQSTNPTLPTNGGGIAIEGANLDRTLNGNECGSTNDQDCPPGLTEGIGPGLVIDANLIVGNSAESGSGGGLRIQQINGSADLIAFPTTPSAWYDVTVTNNVIANNVAGYDGGGVSLQDALKVNMINNTVASNDSTASAGALFKTLGAIMSNTPPPGCTPTTDPSLPQNPNCLVADAPHGPQPAGLVVSAHTVNLVDALVGVPTNCTSLAANGYTGVGNANDCRKVSKPHMVNNLFWQNRTFSVNVVDQFGNVVTGNSATPTGKGLQSQQNLIALTPQLAQRSTGECSAGANYWDIGLRTDDVNGGMIPAGTRLALINSLYTGDARSTTIVGSPVSANNQTPTATPLVAPFCNGARMPPEHCTDGGVDNGSPSCKGYNAPAGASETTGLTQVFVFNGIQPTATVDEGHNWLNLSYGPLTLSKPNVGTGTPAEQMLVGGSSGLGTTVGAYSIPSGSAAAGNGTVGTGLPAQVASDYFGNARTINGTTKLDIGAVALTTTAASVRPMALTFGTVAIGASSTLTVTLQAGNAPVTGLNVSTAAPFTASAAGCPATIAAHGSCTVTVTFTPVAPGGAASGSLAVTAGAGGPFLGAPVALTGNGQAIAVNATPATVVFPDTVEAQSNVQTVTLTNLSGSAVTGLAGTVNGTGYSLSGNNCPASLAAGNTCTMSVTFAPMQIGSSSGTLTVAATPAVSTSGPVNLVGNGLPAVPVLTTTSPALAIQGSVVPVTLTGQWFTGATQVNVSGTGVTVSNVAVVNDTTITATFTIARNATVGGRTVTVVTGGGTSNTSAFTVQAPPVVFTAATPPGTLNTATGTLAFGSQNGTVSSTVTVKVNGSAPITFQTAGLAAGSNASYTLGTDTCSGTTVAPGGTCKVTVTFAGAGFANRTADLQLPYTGDLGSPLSLTVTGR